MNPATILAVLALAYYLHGLAPWGDMWCETLDAINPGFFAGENATQEQNHDITR